MRAYLGIDVGTYESKGVLVDGDGAVIAAAARPHRMIVPEPGFAEHRADEDWWGDFVHLTRTLIAESGVDPRTSVPSPPARSAPACCRSTPRGGRS